MVCWLLKKNGGRTTNTQVKEGRSGFRFFLLSVCTASPILVFFASKSSCVCVWNCLKLLLLLLLLYAIKKREEAEKSGMSRACQFVA